MIGLVFLLFAGPIDTTEFLNLNLYQLINVKSDASDRAILQSYQRFHSQRNKSAGVSALRSRQAARTQFAFDVLGSSDSRALYDLAGTNFLNCTSFQVMGYQSDLTIKALKQMVGSLPNDMENYGGMLTFPVQFDLLDFLTGAEKTVTVIRKVKCECPRGKPRCDKCAESRFLQETVREKIILPAGAVQYHRIIGKGLGDTPAGRGAADIVFVAYMKPDPVFQRFGADVLVNVTATLADIIDGKTVDIDNFDGDKLQVPLAGGCQDGEERRIQGRGLPFALDPRKRGDLVVKVNIVFPEELTDAQRRILDQHLPDDPSLYE
jgi:DnaJ-class molecular chaperone